MKPGSVPGLSLSKRLAVAKERIKKLEAQDMDARKALWLGHGHMSVLYGDDGEMQCALCALDFKRMSWEDIAAGIGLVVTRLTKE